MSEGMAILLFYALPLIVLSFLPTLIALCWRRERLPMTFCANLSAVLIGPMAIVPAFAVLLMSSDTFERLREKLHAR